MFLTHKWDISCIYLVAASIEMKGKQKFCVLQSNGMQPILAEKDGKFLCGYIVPFKKIGRKLSFEMKTKKNANFNSIKTENTKP